MADFKSLTGDSGTVAEGDTNFQAPGDTGGSGGDTTDTVVVLEVNGRKFTKTDLIQKITHADQHISKLTGELGEQRTLLDQVNETLKKQVNAAEILAQIKEGRTVEQTNQTTTQPVDANAVAALVMGQLKADDSAKQRDANFKEVSSVLTKAYGDATNAQVARVASENGMTLKEAEDMARARPKVFLKLFPELTAKAAPSVLPTSGRVNAQSLKPDDTRAVSGYTKATSTKQAVSVYLARLRELGVG